MMKSGFQKILYIHVRRCKSKIKTQTSDYGVLRQEEHGELVMLPKRLKLYQAYNIDFGGMADSYKANYMKGLNISGTGIYGSSGCSSGCSGSTFGNIFEGVLDMGMMVGVAALESKSAGKSANASNKQVSNFINNVVAEYPTKMTQIQTKFTTKYAQFGASMDTNGSVTKTYAQIKSDITQQISDLEKSINVAGKDNADKTDGKANLSEYTKLKTSYNGYDQAVKSYDNFETSRSNFLAQHTAIIDSNGKGIQPKAKDYEKYLSEDEKKAGKTGDSTKAFQDAQKAVSDAEADYKKLVDARDKVLKENNVQTKQELEQKRNDAKAQMEEFAQNNKVNDKTTIAQYEAQKKALEGQMAQLGTEADFNKLVKEATDLHSAYNDALRGQDLETRAKESANAAKNDKKAAKKAKRGGHTGLRGMFYDMFHKDSKTYLKDANGKVVTDSNGNKVTAKTMKDISKNSKIVSNTYNEALQEYYNRFK